LLGLRINGVSIEFGVLPTGHVPLDIDTCVMEQSDTAKEGVSWTCAGVEVYCPIGVVPGHARLLLGAGPAGG
jgi:hypothetical protein